MQGGLGRAMAVVLVCAVAAAAQAAEGRLVLTSAQPAEVDAAAAVEVEEASGLARASNATGAYALRGLRGTLTLWTWSVADARAFGSKISMPAEDARARSWELDGGELVGAVAAEAFRLEFVASGTVRVEDSYAGPAAPVWLARPMSSAYPTGAIPVGPAAADDVHFAWEAGWPFVGALLVDDRAFTGGPVDGDARLNLTGEVALEIQGGNATLRREDGGTEEIRTGNWTESDPAPGQLAQVRTQTHARLVFRGTVDFAELPLAGEWGVAGPRATWTLQGGARWREADGEGTVDGRRVEFRAADVAVEGAFAVEVRPEGVVGGANRYEAAGDFETLAVDGAAVAAPAASTVARVSVLAGLAALVALGLKLALPFYTRLRADRLLDHPTRRRLHDAVLASPGIHLRELHRQTGGAWGSFLFHFQALVRAGYLRVTEENRFKMVFASGAEIPDAPLPHPVTRAVFNALPADGSFVAVTELREATGLSRQLLDYHLGKLKGKSLVREAREGPTRAFARAGP